MSIRSFFAALFGRKDAKPSGAEKSATLKAPTPSEKASKDEPRKSDRGGRSGTF